MRGKSMIGRNALRLVRAGLLCPLLLAQALLLSVSDACHAAPAGSESTELWTGRVYTSSYRFAICTQRNGRTRGVLNLHTMAGDVDVYHFVGETKNGMIEMRHSSGHHVVAQPLPDGTVRGSISLKGGRTVSFKGKRQSGVRVTDDCAPIPR